MNPSQDLNNPYSSPPYASDEVPVAAPDGEAEKMRRAHLELETSVRALGGLYYFVSAVLICIALAAMHSLVFDFFQARGLAVAIACGTLGMLGFIYGWGLRRLDPRMRLPVLVTAGVLVALLFFFARTNLGTTGSILAALVGGLISAWVLMPLRSPNIHVVLSPQYHEVRRQTPHIQHRPWLVMMICALVLLSLIGAVAVSALFR